MPTMPNRMVAALVFTCQIIGCATSPSPIVSSDDLLAAGLVPYSLGQNAVITPQIDASTRRGDYFLHYRVSEDGRSIGTRFGGPSEAVGAPLRMRTEHEGDFHSLICYVPRSDYQITLAKWRTDASGQIADAYIRREPFIEWRALGIKPYQLVTDVEWRPLVDGVGVGEWRR
jgi:hypothetical protein